VLSVTEFMHLNSLPAHLRACRCHTAEETPCAACEARAEWRAWTRDRGEEVLALFEAGQPVPDGLVPSYFYEWGDV
jgi:hypothetical protein